MGKGRVCVIGAGPAGMSVLYQYSFLGGKDKPEVVCYEKQDTPGGLWNYTWRTGTDEYGELCHGSMYENLWINAPKECFEIGDYTFKEHFGKAVPSFLPREALKQYMEALWKKKAPADLEKFIKFNHAVRYVRYDSKTGEFLVSVANLKTGTVQEETFSHVVTATGMFSVPNTPNFKGIEAFPGRIIHAHDFRKAGEFKGQRILIIGGSFSAQDIAMMCMKYGSKSVICSWHKAPIDFKWPKGIVERPPLKYISQSTACFEDGSSADVDAIILCTGYLSLFPFMENGLQLKSDSTMYPADLYKGLVWTKGGDNKLFYIGAQYQLYTLPMFNTQASWIWRYILGRINKEPRSAQEMEQDIQKWCKRNAASANLNDCNEFQIAYLADLIEMIGGDNTVTKARGVVQGWLRDRKENIGTFRSKRFASIYTGQEAAGLPEWMTLYEEDIDKICKN